MYRFRLAAFAVALLVAFPLWSGCDSGTTDNPVTADIGIRVSTFTVPANQFSVEPTEERNAFHVRQTNQLTPSVVNDGVVLLYARGDLIFLGAGDTWTALPYTEGFEAVGEDGVPFVDFTISYTYSYGVNELIIDFVSSASLIRDFLPGSVSFKLVTIPGGTQFEGVDYSSYEAVQRAYGLDG